MNHFLSALVFLGGQRSHRSRHFILCEFHRSISKVSSCRHASSALTLPGIVLFSLKSGLISQQRPHISLRWNERPCRSALLSPPPPQIGITVVLIVREIHLFQKQREAMAVIQPVSHCMNQQGNM